MPKPTTVMPYGDTLMRPCCVPDCPRLGRWGKSRRGPAHRQRYSRSSWQTIRREALKHARWRCSGCGARGDLVVHRTGPSDAPTSLRVLCRSCHELHHLGVEV